MCRDDGPTIDIRRHLGDGKEPITPLCNPREIGWWRLEYGRGRTITTAVHAMACATVAHKVLLPRAHGRARETRWLLRHCRCHAEECPPHDHHPKNEPLHALPPVRRGLRLGAHGYASI